MLDKLLIWALAYLKKCLKDKILPLLCSFTVLLFNSRCLEDTVTFYDTIDRNLQVQTSGIYFQMDKKLTVVLSYLKVNLENGLMYLRARLPMAYLPAQILSHLI